MIYINGIGIISPQNSFQKKDFPEDIVEPEGSRLNCVEPDYKQFIPLMKLRRMPRLMKMALTASQHSLVEAGIEKSDAIIVGTALGGIEFLEKFLLSVIEKDERALSPTPFIQSTHNTVASQIALLQKNHGYNMTYTHRSFSFEWALKDAIMLLDEKSITNAMVGGIDVNTENHFKMYSYIDAWKKTEDDFFNPKTNGTIAGEGASFFILSDEFNSSTYAELVFAETFIEQEKDLIYKKIEGYLADHSSSLQDLDLIILGNSGCKEKDAIFHGLTGLFPENISLAFYKHICGEYFTSSSFALWLAALIIKNQNVPDYLMQPGAEKPSKAEKILIYNQTGKDQNSFILVKKP
ncbi:MAG: 3-oxoacyl-ACP synthase [Marinilabiliales bacterium]|nr:MAG: 3-oxoacyl-ACP synthase [Marinilabiliales bacterium]